MITALAITFFVFGLIIGSFLNVVIYRYNTHRSFRGRSGCMTCQNKLKWYDMVPVASFLFLKGRCRNCKTKISVQYPIVELLTGLFFLAMFLKMKYYFFFDTEGFSISYAYYATIFFLFMVIAVYDIKHKIIPDALSFFLGVISFLGLFFFSGFYFFPHIPSLLEFLSGIIIALPFALLWILSGGKWMGLGDAKLALSLGWILGLSLALSGLVIAFWSGALIGILLILFSKKFGIKSEIPFAPFLIFGTVLVFLFEFYVFSIYF